MDGLDTSPIFFPAFKLRGLVETQLRDRSLVAYFGIH